MEMQRKRIFRYILALVLGLTVIACSNLKAEQMTAKEREALSVGEKFVAGRYADFDKRNKTPVLKDGGDYWEFTYELPEDMIGGAPVAIIYKRSMQVIRSF